MASPLTWSPGPPTPTTDPNELLQRINANTTTMLNWVKYGFIAVLVLLAIIAIIG